MKHAYTLQQAADAINNSFSFRGALILLGISPQGGNYSVIHRLCKQHNLSIDHFTGKIHSKGKLATLRQPTEKYLNNEIPINSFRLRNRLLREKIFDWKCTCCLNTIWLGKPIPLELDHINGNSLDNTLTNLRLLCPNCHAQTPNYRGKNKVGVRGRNRTDKP